MMSDRIDRDPDDDRTRLVVPETRARDLPTSVWEVIVGDRTPPPRVILHDEPTRPPGESTEPPPHTSTGRYQILGEIARGGMGAVLWGRDSELNRDLAVKVLLERFRNDPEVLRRFFEEAQIGGQLQHPGIVPIYDLGTFDDNRPFFAMKLVRGRTLAALLGERRFPSDDLPHFLSVFGQVAQTVAYAHSKGVIHRDLKPANIMVGAFGEVQVMDWGLAKVLADGEGTAGDGPADVSVSVIRTARSESDSDASRSGSVMGTPAYMAPEQARGEVEVVDRRSDVFGLGAILCEVLTGSPAYIGRKGEVLRMAERADLADAMGRLDACDAESDLISLAKSCLAAEPAGRPRDAGAVARAITGHLAGVQDRLRASEIARAEATARAEAERTRRKFTAALAASLLLAVTVGGGSWMAFRLDRDARVAEADRLVGDAIGRAEALRAEAERAGGEAPEPWGRALTAAEKAKEALAGRPARPELAKRVESLHALVARRAGAVREQVKKADAIRMLISQLDEARLQEADIEDGHFDVEAKLSSYAKAFREAGIDPLTGEPKEVAAHLGAKSGAERIAAVLDDWAMNEPDGARKEALVAISRSIDPGRNRIRDAIRKHDRAALLALAREDGVRELPPPSVIILAKTLKTLGERADAVRLLTEAQGRFPGDFWINNSLGIVHLQGLPPAREETVRFFTAAVALKPDSPGALLNLGLALSGQGRLDEAVAAYREAIRIRPDYASAHSLLGYALGMQGKPDEAVAACREAIRLRPDYANNHTRLGSVLSQQGKLDEAVASCREAIRLRPDYAYGHVKLASILRNHGRLDEAAAALREATRLDPRNASTHFLLGSILSRQGELGGAVAALREAIRLQPDYAAAHVSIGNAFAKQGKRDEAVASYREAIRLDPQNSSTRSLLSSALDAQGKRDEAAAFRDEPPRVEPRDASAYIDLGLSLSGQGKLDEAIAAYREAIRLEPRNAHAHVNLGLALSGQGKRDEAVAAHREAVRLRPDLASAHNALGSALRLQGRLDEAVAAYREAIRLRPDAAIAHYHLGRCLKSQGLYREALASVRKAHELGSKEPGWRLPSAKLVEECEALVELEERLPALLDGSSQPKDEADRLALGRSCYDKGLYAASARFLGAALSMNSKLGDDRKAGHRYAAARSAALAGSGRGRDDPKPDDAARARLRAQARGWLREELATLAKARETATPKARDAVAETLAQWKADADLAGVRDAEATAKLPEEERTAWQALWADVEALTAKARAAK